jgi:SH3-like domain-containing protein
MDVPMWNPGKPLSRLVISLVWLMMGLVSHPTFALDFKSVAVPKAVLYDAPSAAAKKVRLLSQFYPVEVIVDLGDWVKVRDARGSINWVEAKQLSAKRMVMITTSNAELRQSADAASALLATLEKDVALEVADEQLNNGWLKVRHRDGLTGFILISSTWGFN